MGRGTKQTLIQGKRTEGTDITSYKGNQNYNEIPPQNGCYQKDRK